MGDEMKNNMTFPLVTEKDKQLPYYVLSVGCDYIQELIDRQTGYPTYQWIQSVSGEGELLIDGNRETVGAHQAMFLYPDVPHSYYSKSGKWMVHWISFLGNGMEHFLKASGISSSGVYFVKNEELLGAKLRKVLNIAQSNSSLKNIEASSVMYEILMDILMYASKSSDASTEQQYLKLSAVFDYVESNYSRVITLEELSMNLNITPQHLCVLFKQITGMRPFEYINSVRISKSKDIILNNSKLEINEIAAMVGYDNTSYFCSIFKKLEGISPGKFKKLHGQ